MENTKPEPLDIHISNMSEAWRRWLETMIYVWMNLSLANLTRQSVHTFYCMHTLARMHKMCTLRHYLMKSKISQMSFLRSVVTIVNKEESDCSASQIQ